MKIVTVVGARPQFVKAAMISKAIALHNRAAKVRPRIVEILVHTGQHYDDNMSRIFFDELEIPKPDYHLGVGSEPHGKQTGMMLEKIERVLLEERPDWVLVYGDTNSTLAGALAAVKLHMPVVHVEAGLRSFNRRMPEEINRVITDHVSSLLFCPTERAVENLRREGITRGVYHVGDVMYDSVLYHLKWAEEKSSILDRLKLQPKRYFLFTLHRQENTEDPERLASILATLASLDRPVVLPLHPRTKRVLQRYTLFTGDWNGLRIIPPVSYLDMLILEKHARIILTDSGGIQKEAYFFKVPCITLRDETEWVETVESGWNRVVGMDRERVLEAIFSFEAFEQDRSFKDCYGDARASRKILGILINEHMGG